MANTDLFFSAFGGNVPTGAATQPAVQTPVPQPQAFPAQQQAPDMFGLMGLPMETQTQTPAPSLPPGLNIDQLDAESRYNLLLRYPQHYIEQYGDKSTYEKILAEAKEDRDSAKAAEANLAPYRNALTQAKVSSRDDAQLLELIDGARGNVQDFFVGTNPKDAWAPQSFMRMFLDSEAANVSAALSQIISSQALENYDKLRGAGSISNFEVELGKSAASSIDTRGTKPEDIVRQLRVIQAMVDLGEFRSKRNIRIGDDGREWMWDANNENPQRVVTTRNPQTGELDFIPLPDPNMNVISVPFNLIKEDFLKNYYSKADDGTIIIYNGEAFTKGGDNDRFKSEEN